MTAVKSIRREVMLLVCGGSMRAINQDHSGEHLTGIPHYPHVIAVVEEDSLAKLEAILATVIDPFVVRLSDKNLAKIIDSPAGRKALRENGGLA
jgi:hypothetical protein